MSKTYTAEMTARVVDAYTAVAEKDYDERDATVRQIAGELGVSVASVRAKLVREGVYVAREDVDKTGAPRAKKDTLVTRIAEVMKVTEDALPGLEKAGKPALQKILAALTTKAGATAES